MKKEGRKESIKKEGRKVLKRKEGRKVLRRKEGRKGSGEVRKGVKIQILLNYKNFKMSR